MTEIPKRVEKPWGYELWWARTDRYVGKILHLRRGESLSLQYHSVKDETIMLQSGRLLFETRPTDEDGELRRIEMKPGDVFHITPGHAAPHDRPRGLRHRRGLDAGAGRRGPARRPLRPRGHVEAVGPESGVLG